MELLSRASFISWCIDVMSNSVTELSFSLMWIWRYDWMKQELWNPDSLVSPEPKEKEGEHRYFLQSAEHGVWKTDAGKKKRV